MLSRILAGAIAVLLLALAGVGWMAKSQYDAASALRIENKGLTEAAERAARRAKSDRKVLVARQAEIALQARKLAQADQALSEALQRNKSWSDTDVPPDVQKALSGASSPVPDGL